MIITKSTPYTKEEIIQLQEGSQQQDLWGGGINLETKEIDYNSFINIRPQQNNTTIEMQDSALKERFEELMREYFKEVYE